MSSLRIIWLGEAGSEQPALVGGKAATLSRLIGRYPVPPGFCATGLVATADGRLPDDAIAAIRAAYRALGEAAGRTEPAVAVRSSGGDEDSAHASFAGVHETVLEVTGEDAVVAAVARVAASLTGETARAYRSGLGIAPGAASAAVLIQLMIAADAAFVAFSANPLGADQEMVVSGAWGLGAGVVDGTITPETYVIRRSDHVIVQHLYGQQDRQAVAVSGGTVLVELPPERRAARGFDDRQIATICELVARLESELGYAVDVEGARVGDTLYLLQCRPITTGFPVSWDSEQDRVGTWLREDIHFPRVVSRAGGDYARHGMYTGLARLQSEQAWPSLAEARIFHGYVYVNWLYLCTHEALDDARVALQAANLARARRALDDWRDAILPRVDALCRAIDDACVEPGPLATVERVWRGIWDAIAEVWYLHFRLLYPCMAAARGLQALCGELFDAITPLTALHLTQGRVEQFHHLASDLHALAGLARDRPAVLARITSPTPERWSELRADPAAAAFVAGVDRFLAQHGHLGAEDDDLATGTWADAPHRVLGEVRRALDEPDPEHRRARLLAESDQLLAALRDRLADRPDDQARFDEAVALARAVVPWIDDHNYFLDRKLHAATRRAYLRAGAALVRAGVLAQPCDIFELDRDEIVQLLAAPVDSRARIAERRREHERCARLRPPLQLTSQPGVDPEPAPASAAEPGVLRGVAAAAGVARGRARIVRCGSAIDTVHAGDVLVCHNVNLAWLTRLPTLAGLVASTGGMLSHAAIAAREFRIPSVVGLAGAIERIADGSLIEVDGGAGTVRILAG